jgi:succinyl-diaminopimelate desuccinylase
VTQLDELAIEFVNLASPSRDEAALADLVERRLREHDHLEVIRIGDNVVARTSFGRRRRVVVAGHLDTVSTGDAISRVDGRVLWGLGAADMKGTLAAMLLLAGSLAEPSVDLTWVFYAREEIGRAESGLLEIERVDQSLLEGEVAILGEPTDGIVEAGCQGTLRLSITLAGVTAHTARPFMGVNAIHRSVPLLAALAAAAEDPRVAVIDGVAFAEQIQVVGISGGSAGNVVPGSATIVVNHRFAPDRDVEEALAWVRTVVDPHLDLSAGDQVVLDDGANGAAPHLDDAVLRRLIELGGGAVRAKVGWTDVATFAAIGVPAANFGAGDPLVAHHPDERVDLDSLEDVHRILFELLTDPTLA